jgi:hypothetical protein
MLITYILNRFKIWKAQEVHNLAEWNKCGLSLLKKCIKIVQEKSKNMLIIKSSLMNILLFLNVSGLWILCPIFLRGWRRLFLCCCQFLFLAIIILSLPDFMIIAILSVLVVLSLLSCMRGQFIRSIFFSSLCSLFMYCFSLDLFQFLMINLFLCNPSFIWLTS